MTAIRTSRRGAQWSNAFEVITRGCAVLGLAALGACATLTEIMNRPPQPETRVQLRSQTETLFLTRSEMKNYICIEPLYFICGRSGTLYSCSCQSRRPIAPN